MAKIYIKPRGGFGKETLFKELKGVHWTYEVVPYMSEIDHKKYAVRVTDFDEYCDEWCPHCNRDVVIPSFGISFCPNCGKDILPCSMCDADYTNCGKCPYYETTELKAGSEV